MLLENINNILCEPVHCACTVCLFIGCVMLRLTKAFAPQNLQTKKERMKKKTKYTTNSNMFPLRAILLAHANTKCKIRIHKFEFETHFAVYL